jgi:hypothetical protein
LECKPDPRVGFANRPATVPAWPQEGVTRLSRTSDIRMSAISAAKVAPFPSPATTDNLAAGIRSAVSRLCARVLRCGLSRLRAPSFSQESDYGMPSVSTSWGNPEFVPDGQYFGPRIRRPRLQNRRRGPFCGSTASAAGCLRGRRVSVRIVQAHRNRAQKWQPLQPITVHPPCVALSCKLFSSSILCQIVCRRNGGCAMRERTCPLDGQSRHANGESLRRQVFACLAWFCFGRVRTRAKGRSEARKTAWQTAEPDREFPYN